MNYIYIYIHILLYRPTFIWADYLWTLLLCAKFFFTISMEICRPESLFMQAHSPRTRKGNSIPRKERKVLSEWSFAGKEIKINCILRIRKNF